ncbi:DNA gyrase, A subunit [Desulfarculus baarsii DSM 2075]|uniref:DNA gyrase subunit A n=1 Tax=Desulfarculus baarsii (strain ATCC 33931 / DSM 2075 / LMG 7858 / VKM B-1802 / 2st14) TaxID=644282 RepID=E1QGC8_DESB2|nr:DNA gyrase subunit A [Desulfarculus baarsii]ADK83640.1 DNA gyrase, A subunit [Desulfarculus baarsii DSM 2075]
MLPKDARKEDVRIEEEIRRSYLDYAMSVIVGRALPDARDGLKPVHRRILFAMRELRNDFNKPYKKSARVVGDVIGKYHPHGDSAVYDALVRMAQDFAMRYTLVDGQGNFGSVDGDAAAAMRYTEVRMAKLANELLADIDKDTVDFTDNYDGSLKEPVVLPTKAPALLINGSSGIAVGMATNIPPHNLGEVARALVALLDNPDIGVRELMRHVPGPDFPTRGFIHGAEGIEQAYRDGRGSIQIRAKANIETVARTKKTSIIVTELPYQVNKARLLEKVAELVKDKKIEGISDLRDESDRDGMRVVFDLRRDAVPQVVLNQLFKFTQMQTTFGINMLAIDRGRPRLMGLKDVLELFIEHRREIVLRRTAFDLAKAEARAHILEGLRIALDNLDEVIELIRAAKNPAEAKDGLMSRFSLSEKQAQAILEMRLQRLTGLERDKIMAEYREVIKEIARLRHILESDEEVRRIIREETLLLAEEFGDKRRTEIVGRVSDIELEDMIAEEEMVVTLSHGGYIKRTPTSLYRAQRRGGKGSRGMATKDEDFVEDLFTASTHSYLLIFTDAGRLYWLKVHEIPQAGRASRGKAIVNLVQMLPDESVSTVLAVREFVEGRQVIMATQKGVIKKTELMSFSRPRAGGIIAINLAEGDHLVSARLTDGEMEVFLATRQGQAIRFHESQVRSMGRAAAGVKGIDVEHDDQVVAMEAVAGAPTMLTITENGFGKRTRMDEYPARNRAGKGVITIKTTTRNGHVVSALVVGDDDEVMLITDVGKVIRMKVGGISVIGRNTQGVKLIDLEPGERLVAVARLAEPGDDEVEAGELPDEDDEIVAGPEPEDE